MGVNIKSFNKQERKLDNFNFFHKVNCQHEYFPMQACNNISITSQLSACILINISVAFIVKIDNNKNRNSCNMNKRIWLINWWFLCCCNDLCDTVTGHVFGSCRCKKTTYHSCASKLDDSFVHYSMSLVLSPTRVKQFHIHFCLFMISIE